MSIDTFQLQATAGFSHNFFLCTFGNQINTEVYIVWAMHSTTDANPAAANLGPQHTSWGRSANKQNLIAMAMAAVMTPTTTIMMMPSTSVVSTPQPTGNNSR